MDEPELLRRLVREYSPSGMEGGAVREFVRSSRHLGFRARVDRVGNGVAVRGRGRPRIVFLGHIDTVAGPLPVRSHAGRLYGRGTVDAKGALAAALIAGRDLTGPGEFRVIACVGEETDSRGARYVARRLRPDAVIAGEPSGWDGVAIGYKGELRVRGTLRSSRTHYSSPKPTAADRIVDWVSAVRAFVQDRTDDSPFHSLSVKVIDVASRQDGDIETASATLDLRLPPGLSTSEVLSLLPKTARVGRVDVEVRIEPLLLERTNAVAAAIVDGVRAEGGHPTLWRKSGTSDLNIVAPKWRVPAAIYGPGDSHLDHSGRESISIIELQRSVRVLRFALRRLQGSDTPGIPSLLGTR